MNDPLVAAISVLVDDDARAHISGTVTHEAGGDTRSISFSADGRSGVWTYSLGHFTLSKDVNAVISERNGTRSERPRSDRPDYVPLELRLLFPKTLPVWDRPGDEWRVSSAEKSDTPDHLGPHTP